MGRNRRQMSPRLHLSRACTRTWMQRGNLENVRSGDIWINDREDHAGLVVRVMPNLHPHEMPEITIRHDSSRQHGLATNDFEHCFHGQGWFCR